MKICIAIVCCVLGVTACKSDKSDSTKTDPPKSTTTTVEPAGSAAPTPPAADPHAGHQGSGSAAGSAAAPAAGSGPDCATEFDHSKAADKHMACVECEKHRGHGTMEAECKNAIAKPWK